MGRYLRKELWIAGAIEDVVLTGTGEMKNWTEDTGNLGK